MLGVTGDWAFVGYGRAVGRTVRNSGPYMLGVTGDWAFVGYGRAVGRTVRNSGPYLLGLDSLRADYSLASAGLTQSDSKIRVFGLKSGYSDNSSDTP